MKKVLGYILVSVLMLLVGFGAGYLLFNNKESDSSKTKKTTTDVQEVKTENIDPYSDVVSGIIDQLYMNSMKGANPYFKETDKVSARSRKYCRTRSRFD